MTHPLILLGASGHARVVLDTLRAAGQFQPVGFVDDNAQLHGTTIAGLPVLGAVADLPALRDRLQIKLAHAAVGHNATRLALASAALQAGLELATAVHPSAVVGSGVTLGAGSFLAPHAVVNCNSTLGRCVIVNTAASVDHDCTLRDGAFVGPGAHLAGHVTVGTAAFVGIGSAVREGVAIGDHAVLGAGSVVVHDIAPHVVAYGNPARAHP